MTWVRCCQLRGGGETARGSHRPNSVGAARHQPYYAWCHADTLQSLHFFLSRKIHTSSRRRHEIRPKADRRKVPRCRFPPPPPQPRLLTLTSVDRGWRGRAVAASLQSLDNCWFLALFIVKSLISESLSANQTHSWCEALKLHLTWKRASPPLTKMSE